MLLSFFSAPEVLLSLKFREISVKKNKVIDTFQARLERESMTLKKERSHYLFFPSYILYNRHTVMTSNSNVNEIRCK